LRGRWNIDPYRPSGIQRDGEPLRVLFFLSEKGYFRFSAANICRQHALSDRNVIRIVVIPSIVVNPTSHRYINWRASETPRH
jgi:hypothetical protein